MMRSSDSVRTDALLALAFTFAVDAVQTTAHETNPHEDSIAAGVAGNNDGEQAYDPLAIFGSLPVDERARLREQATQLTSLPIFERAAWIESVLRRHEIDGSHLDEHVHPSHVFVKLSDEPPHVRRIVIAQLPAALAATIAATLDEVFDGDDDDPTTLRRLAPEVADVVRQTFLKGFVQFDSLKAPTALDRLSGIELRRLIRSLGVRETAIACRGIEAVETVASFLRRFGAEDARAVASHITSLTDIDAARVRRAETTIRRLLERENDPTALLYRTGLRVLAAGADWRDEQRLQYTLQKLHVDAAGELRGLIRTQIASGEGRVVTGIAAEVERLAAKIHGAETETNR